MTDPGSLFWGLYATKSSFPSAFEFAVHACKFPLNHFTLKVWLGEIVTFVTDAYRTETVLLQLLLLLNSG